MFSPVADHGGTAWDALGRPGYRLPIRRPQAPAARCTGDQGHRQFDDGEPVERARATAAACCGAWRSGSLDLAWLPRHTRIGGYRDVVIRTLNLGAWAGLWVGVNKDGTVLASASELDVLIAQVDERDLDVEIMRAPVPGEPVVFGLG